MLNQFDTQRFIILVVLLVAFVLLTLTQNNPPFLLLLPILVLTLGISWYLYNEIRKDHEENLKREVRYVQEEQEAQAWLHKSFVPKVRRLAQKDMQVIIVGSGILLMSFIFLWSFFVTGLLAAVLNTIIGLFFFICFIIYALYAPKEFGHLFKHVPQRYRHHSKNDWVHAYLLLFPFAILGFFIYSITTTGEGIIGSFVASIIFLFSYTFIFICIYCVWYLYREYQKENEQSIKRTAKKILEES